MSKIRIPNTYVIISVLIVLAAALTWFVPGGEYVRGEDGVLAYRSVESVPQTWQVFSSLYHGFEKQAGIIVFILVVGGAFWILNATGAVSSGIGAFIRRIGRYDTLVLVSVAVLFSLGGAVFGMSEETIPFVGIVVPLVVGLGYDAFMGMLIVYVAANIGFSSAFLNPFTIGVAQKMCDLPLFSGMPYRVVCWAILTLAMCVFIVVYAKRSRRKVDLPQAAVDAGGRGSAAPGGQDPAPLTRRQVWILVVLGLTVVALVVGVTVWKWYMPEITALFLVMGIVCGAVAGFGPNRIADEFVAGAKDILSAALVVGLASGIVVVLQDGKVIDSLLHSMQEGLDGTGSVASLGAMYGIQAVINFLIPSATAKAAITIPIMAPFSDMVGVSRQAMVMAFQFGDGFTNMVTPTSGVLVAALAMARIPYSKWMAKVWKWVLALLVVGFLLLLPTLFVPLAGF